MNKRPNFVISIIFYILVKTSIYYMIKRSGLDTYTIFLLAFYQQTNCYYRNDD